MLEIPESFNIAAQLKNTVTGKRITFEDGSSLLCTVQMYGTIYFCPACQQIR